MVTKCEKCGNNTPPLMQFRDTNGTMCCNFCFQNTMYGNVKNIVFYDFTITQWYKSKILPKYSYIVHNVKKL